ncbi:PLP-dependent aminotransferase family protein [uncultured Pseudacidovorax sp.]|uniref:aminotransferase-like domain-containing protein n=1 Tax=uncultured Pseudacidovorax sp. TaxID=679313 RepID=UPI0025E4995F|nr:PLP-dependent aminotransferase family protein [uncultured Pseudacidovorax sp.]
MPFSHWAARLRHSELPAYQLIPDLLAEDLQRGRLAPRDRLPPLRDLAQQLGLNYTTVVRGFAQARERGLIASRPGLGSYVRGSFIGLPLRGGTGAEMTMNMPPELNDHPVGQQLQDEAAAFVAATPVAELMRYQDFGGTPRDREAAAHWLRQWVGHARAEHTLVAPGIHSVLLALLSLLVRPGQSLAVESLLYPGLKAIAAQLGTQLQPLQCDEEGIVPQSFETLCKSASIGALYLCPNLHNPTTATLSLGRREALADIAAHHSVPIIEDDAYGMLAPAVPPPLADFAPALTYYVSGTSKWLGAGLRNAFVLAPTDAATQRLAGALRATTVMASPLTTGLVTHWLGSGLAAQALDAMRAECSWRSALARELLGDLGLRTHPQGFHAWLPLDGEEEGGTGGRCVSAELAQQLQQMGVAAVASQAFSTDRMPPEALRLCLGGPLTRDDCGRALRAVRDAVLGCRAA